MYITLFILMVTIVIANQKWNKNFQFIPKVDLKIYVNFLSYLMWKWRKLSLFHSWTFPRPFIRNIKVFIAISTPWRFTSTRAAKAVVELLYWLVYLFACCGCISACSSDITKNDRSLKFSTHTGCFLAS